MSSAASESEYVHVWAHYAVRVVGDCTMNMMAALFIATVSRLSEPPPPKRSTCTMVKIMRNSSTPSHKYTIWQFEQVWYRQLLHQRHFLELDCCLCLFVCVYIYIYLYICVHMCVCMYTYLRRPWLGSVAASRDHSWLGIRWKRVQLSGPKWMLLPLTLCVNVWGSVRTFVCDCIAEKSRAWEGMSGQSHFVRCHHKNTVTLRGRAQRWRKKGGLQRCSTMASCSSLLCVCVCVF